MENLETIERWRGLLKKSHKEPVIIYKHSNYCAVCSRAISVLQDAIDAGKINFLTYKVAVHDNRDVSDVIAEDLQLRHESPQLIIVKEGQILYFANHYDINAQDMLEYLGE